MPQAAKTTDAPATNGDAPNMLEASGPFVAALIHQAKMLEGEIDEKRETIGKNREQLRNLDELGALSVEQGDWLESFYATKTKGEQRSEEEVKATKRLKEEARKYYREHKS